jgi:putative ABC transport system ATP-binding protein
MEILEARHIYKSYRTGRRDEVRALDDVSLSISAGSFAVLTGPSGSGKTTLLALLGALERPSSGHILWRGEDLSRLSDMALARVRRRMGFVFQDSSLIPRLSVWENITYPLIPCAVPRARRWARARALLETLGMLDKLTVPSEELSGGEKQRVAVARALVAEPEVLLADEPTSNLDPDASAGLLAQLRALHEGGTTVILSSHDPQMATLGTCVFALAAGRLQQPPPTRSERGQAEPA